jgi:hypothetical protein
MEGPDFRKTVLSRYMQHGLPLYEVVLEINHANKEADLDQFVGKWFREETCETLLSKADDLALSKRASTRKQ